MQSEGDALADGILIKYEFEWPVVPGGVIVRHFGLASSEYPCLLNFFHSSAFSVQALCARWVELIGQRAPLLLLGGRPVYVADGFVSDKAGKKNARSENVASVFGG